MDEDIAKRYQLRRGSEMTDKVFQEENIHLDKIISLIRIEISNSNEPYPGVTNYSTGIDYDDFQDIIYARKRNERYFEKIELLKRTSLSPYFARMDCLYNQNEEISVYLGKQSLEIGGDILVYDWRSTFGEQYYNKSEIQFRAGQIHYRLLLRRAIQIIDSILITYNNEYQFGDEILDSGVTDPFLINALREKRNDKKLTDIIITIQKNQNEIIRRAYEESFIVQGCAGSGKTMVMLHRLSLLVYNNPNLNLSKIKIITPSMNFNFFINDLTKELGLGEIDVLSIDNYYKSLFVRYGINKWEKTKIHPYLEMRDDAKYFYSREVYNLFKGYYGELMKECFNYAENIRSVCEEKGRKNNINTNQISNKSDIDTIVSAARGLMSNFKENNLKIKELKGRIRKLMEELSILEVQQKKEKDESESKYNFETNKLVNIKKDLEFELKNSSRFRDFFRRNRIKSSLIEIEFKISEFMDLERIELTENQKIQNTKKNIEVQQKRMTQIENETLSNEQYNSLDSIIKDINETYTIKNIEDKTIIRIIKEYYQGHGRNSPKEYYRHNLYLYLILCIKYFGPLSEKDSFLNIDEGQDIFPSEYSMITLANSDVKWNIYGDIAQVIHDGYGIADWGIIEKLVKTKFYLSENYRNTTQIAKYVLDEEKIFMQSIGINGPEVQSLKPDDAEIIIRNSLKSHESDNLRIAIICDESNKEVMEKYIELGIGRNDIISGNMNVFTLLEAKGLEFEKVYIYTKGMNKNGRYIGYTRCLYELFVISD